MTASFEAEIARQAEIAVGYSPDPENVQAHLDSWAERHARVRVRLVGVEGDETSHKATFFAEMVCVEAPPKPSRPDRPTVWIGRAATFLACTSCLAMGIFLLGIAVGLARWLGGVL